MGIEWLFNGFHQIINRIQSSTAATNTLHRGRCLILPFRLMMMRFTWLNLFGCFFYQLLLHRNTPLKFCQTTKLSKKLIILTFGFLELLPNPLLQWMTWCCCFRCFWTRDLWVKMRLCCLKCQILRHHRARLGSRTRVQSL
jgi:hypothetical protein